MRIGCTTSLSQGMLAGRVPETYVIRTTRPHRGGMAGWTRRMMTTPGRPLCPSRGRLSLGAQLCRRAGRSRCFGLLVARLRGLVFGSLARAALHVLLAIAPRRLEARIGLLGVDRHHLLDRPAGILVIVELGRCRALRVAGIGIALEMIGQRREADREVVAVAQAHAERPVGRERQVAELVGVAARAVALLAPVEERVARRVAPARLGHVLLAAAVARELADDGVLEGAVERADDLAALGIEVGQPLPAGIHLAGELDAARRAPERLGEQELVPAVRAVELLLGDLVVALELAHVVLDARQQVAILVAALRLGHQLALELDADVAALAEALGLAGRRHLARGQLPRRQLIGRSVDRLARPRRVGLRPRPPAPALRQGVRRQQA